MQFKMRFACPSRKNRLGQSLIESCIAIALICVVFIGALQVSQVFAAREILYRAATAGARARTVGLNDFMVHKVVRVSTIPIAGQIIVPDDAEEGSIAEAVGYNEDTTAYGVWTKILSSGMPASAVFDIEEARISSYLSAYNSSRAENVLDYADWDTIENDAPESDDTLVTMVVELGYTNWLALPRTFFASEVLELEVECELENHYSLYMDDSYAGGW